MNISKNGLNNITNFEGLSLVPYKDSAGIPTIGYGTILYPNGNKVTMADPAITRDEALEYLEWEVNLKVAGINHMIQVSVNQNQFDALVSFAYNEGVEALRTSTLLRLLNSGDTQGAANQFPVWDKARVDGQLVEVDGLLKRRKAEQALFLTPINPVV